MAILTIDSSFLAIILDRKIGYSRVARGHSRIVTFRFDVFLGLAFYHELYLPILYASVWFSY